MMSALIVFSCSSQNDIRTKPEQPAPQAHDKALHITENKKSNPTRLAPQATNWIGIKPVRMYIPAIDLHADIEPVRVSLQGSMDVPKSTETIGYLEDGTLPGAKGNAVMDGHVDSYTGPAVFYHLKKLKPGDSVYVKDAKGTAIEFRVEAIGIYKTDNAPVQSIFGPSDEPRLNLITCTGKYSRKMKEHQERLVVYTKRAGA